VDRTGYISPEEVEQDLDARLNDLMEASQLRRPRITKKRGTDNKTKVATVTFSVVAESSWENAMQFIQRVYALPHLAQFSKLKITPVGGKRKTLDKVKLDGDIDVIVVPKMKGVRVKVPEAAPEGEVIKYTQDDLLAFANPFIEPPKVVIVDPPPPPPPDDDDEEEMTPASLWERDPDGDQKKITTVWTSGTEKDGVCVAHRRKTSEPGDWVEVGGELDGGEILLVHPLGAVVRTPDGDEYVYALGETLSSAIPLEEAFAYPEIQTAVARREAVEALDEDFVGPPDLSNVTAVGPVQLPLGNGRKATGEDDADPAAAESSLEATPDESEDAVAKDEPETKKEELSARERALEQKKAAAASMSRPAGSRNGTGKVPKDDESRAGDEDDEEQDNEAAADEDADEEEGNNKAGAGGNAKKDGGKAVKPSKRKTKTRKTPTRRTPRKPPVRRPRTKKPPSKTDS
jgi:hypothetical protein